MFQCQVVHKEGPFEDVYDISRIPDSMSRDALDQIVECAIELGYIFSSAVVTLRDTEGREVTIDMNDGTSKLQL